MFEYLRPEKRTLTRFGNRLETAFPGGPNVAATIRLRAKKPAKHLRLERRRAGPGGLQVTARRFLSTIFKKDSTKRRDSCMMMLSPTCMKKATHAGGIRKRGNKAPRGYFRLRGKRDGCASNRPFLYAHCSDAAEVQNERADRLGSVGSHAGSQTSQALFLAGAELRVACQQMIDPVTTRATPFQKARLRSAPIQKVAKMQERTGVK